MKTKEPIKVQIKGQVPFSVLLTKNSNYVGICEPLKLTLQANTFSNLMEDMALTLDAIFKDLLSSNELDKFLRDKGWKVIGQIPRNRSDMFFDLPFIPAMVKKQHGEKRAFCQ